MKLAVLPQLVLVLFVPYVFANACPPQYKQCYDKCCPRNWACCAPYGGFPAHCHKPGSHHHREAIRERGMAMC
ncbi:hypothetical protein BZA77DRAFT_310883 [Pyronema omphalodes]|nr:hypothetical protein BZA77DRAFT_310883 [Pyronema omphalodes]